MDRSTLITLGAVALLLGAVTPMMAAADEYDEIGTADEGVYAVTADEQRLRVAAAEPADVVVATPTGEVVDARSMDADETHTIVLDGSEALVAVLEGAAEIQAKGDGNVQAAETTTETVRLVEAEGSALDRSLTVQVPEGTLLAQASLDGQADRLDVTLRSDGEQLLTAPETDLAEPAQLAPEAAHADALDVQAQARSLNGSVTLTFTSPVQAAAEPASTTDQRSADGEEGYNATVDVDELEHTPIAFTVPDGEPGRLVANLTTGHVFDASVYNADGAQVHHLHAGVALDEHREQCEVHECWHGWQNHEEFAPQTIEQELEPGDYVLYVREGDAQGTLTVEHPNRNVLSTASEGELASLGVADDRTLETDQPVLDVWRSVTYEDARVQQTVTVAVENETAYELSALAKSFGRSVQPQLELAPGQFGAGEVTVTVDSARDDVLTTGDAVTVYVLAE